VARERLCVLIIEHDLDLVRQISSHIILLHLGQVALDGSVADFVDASRTPNVALRPRETCLCFIFPANG
jgi:ABC-type branched-subunit amino acid transport system ATPase component